MNEPHNSLWCIYVVVFYIGIISFGHIYRVSRKTKAPVVLPSCDEPLPNGVNCRWSMEAIAANGENSIAIGASSKSDGIYSIGGWLTEEQQAWNKNRDAMNRITSK